MLKTQLEFDSHHGFFEVVWERWKGADIINGLKRDLVVVGVARALVNYHLIQSSIAADLNDHHGLLPGDGPSVPLRLNLLGDLTGVVGVRKVGDESTALDGEARP